MGREDELCQISQLLSGQAPRLVTITVPGGIGKRLALAAAEQLLDYLLVMVTSRERLSLKEESIFEVTGLPCPPEGDLEAWVGYSAVRLFLENARRVRFNFSPVESEKKAILRICQAVEGMPLGLEMASANEYSVSHNCSND